eukprot:TRINITY_DN30411_c0_g1_i1.p2 TRINITY_DN30411_c0_g1~~TRINITY_DN30411_c0_g1_i1.p2  ORF type:complete len:128 (+),score=21.94 TRINITY_DN30411_c0_g1_i1:70-453(+)
MGDKTSSSTAASTEPHNLQEVEELQYEGGSDHFTTNRHQLHNNEAKSFNLMHFRSEDDAPFIRPKNPPRTRRDHFSQPPSLRGRVRWSGVREGDQAYVEEQHAVGGSVCGLAVSGVWCSGHSLFEGE